MGSSTPLRVIIAGGGVAAVESMIALRHLAGEKVSIELLAPGSHFRYAPLSVTEPFGEDPVEIELARIAADHLSTVRRGSLASVEPDRSVVVTGSGEELPYDALVVACGATRREAVRGAITFYGAPGRDRVGALAAELDAGRISEVVFALPEEAGWSLPLYELALLTATRLAAARRGHAQLSVVTPEREPLEVLGPRASGTLRGLFEERGIALMTGVTPESFDAGHLHLRTGGRIAADAVIALPGLAGVDIPGLPLDASGFVPVGPDGAVPGAEGVYAAGDVCAAPVKQGGLATQQADAIATAIAARAGARVLPPEGDPVLRAVLLTGAEPRFLRATIGSRGVTGSMVSRRPLWRPPSKIASRYLSPYLAGLGALTELEGAHR